VLFQAEYTTKLTVILDSKHVKKLLPR